MPEMDKKRELNIVGKGIPLKDSVEKVTGHLQFGVDVHIPNLVYGKILRSPHPNANITRLDTQKAEALPGVFGVVTHEDAPSWQWENCWYNYRGRILDDTVRYVGDEIAPEGLHEESADE